MVGLIEGEELPPEEDYTWTATPVLDVIEGDFTGESYPMDKERMTIGRGPNNDIQLATDTSVSRHHAQITFENNHYILVDLESSNGTSVNGMRVNRMALHPNDEITIGTSKLVIHPS
jgi:pSer/pThr/pTyr-binding forkhead associated (FHA) protein